MKGFDLEKWGRGEKIEHVTFDVVKERLAAKRTLNPTNYSYLPLFAGGVETQRQWMCLSPFPAVFWTFHYNSHSPTPSFARIE